uniref:Uncharacterized protein n=1 Tax=Meloidogyne javanica TaxID=6303 RepID=A0A915NAM8_MELJA
MAAILAEINMRMNGDGEENVDLIDIADSPPLQLRSRRAICVPASCLNNCDSGNCPYWRSGQGKFGIPCSSASGLAGMPVETAWCATLGRESTYCPGGYRG